MKPTNITKSDEAYRQFLKLVQTIKKKEDFLAVGLNLQELKDCIKHAYKYLSMQRLQNYNTYVMGIKSKIYDDIEKMERSGEQNVEAPDNAGKTEKFNNFVDIISKLVDLDEFATFESVMKKPELITEELFSKNKLEYRITYVKRYLKNNYNELKERINTRSHQAPDNERDDDMSYNNDRSENLERNEKDDGMSDIERSFTDMDTSDEKSDGNFEHDSVSRFSRSQQSTPKSSGVRSPGSQILLDKCTMEQDTMPKVTNRSDADVTENIAEGLKGDAGDEKNDSGIGTTNQISNDNAAASLDNKQSNSEDHQLSVADQNKADLSSNVSSYASDDYNGLTSSWISAQVSSISTQATDCDDDDDLTALGKTKAKLSSSVKRWLSSDGNGYKSITEDSTANGQDNRDDSRRMRKRFKSAPTPIEYFQSIPAETDSSLNKENSVAAVNDNDVLIANIEDSCGRICRREIVKRFQNTITIIEFYDNGIKKSDDNSDHTKNSNDFSNVDEDTTFENIESIGVNDRSPDVSSQTDGESSKYESAKSREFDGIDGTTCISISDRSVANVHPSNSDVSSLGDNDLNKTYNSHDYNRKKSKRSLD